MRTESGFVRGMVLAFVLLVGCGGSAKPVADAGANDASHASDAAVADAGDAATPCTLATDCVPGWTCAAGPGGSSPVCVCSAHPETCNGLDDDCNGSVDDEAALASQCASACVEGACPSVPTSAWLRSTETGTEILVLGSETPTNATTAARRLARAFVAHDSSTTVDVGTYELDAGGSGSFSYAEHYAFVFEPSTAVPARTGSRLTVLDPAAVETLAIVADTTTLLVTFAGTEHRYTRLGDVVNALDPSTPTGATATLRLHELSTYVARSQVLGLGSLTITRYVASVGTYRGFVAGSVSVSVDSVLSPHTHLAYTGYETVTGITSAGTVSSNVNIAGDGLMAGVVTFAIGGSGPSDAHLTGTLDYGGLQLSNGMVAGGTFALTIGGMSAMSLPYTLASDIDLRDVLPVSTP